MSNLMSLSIRTLIYGAVIFSAILVSGVAVNYALAGGPDAADVGVAVEDVQAAHQAAVKRGDLTQEQADERLEAWKKDQAEGLKAREDFRKIDIEDVKAEIRAALASGKITQEQADEKLAWLEANEDSSRKDIVTDSR